MSTNFDWLGVYLDKEIVTNGYARVTYSKETIKPRGVKEYAYKYSSEIRKALHKYEWYSRLVIKSVDDTTLLLCVLKPVLAHKPSEEMIGYNLAYTGVNAKRVIERKYNTQILINDSGSWIMLHNN